MSVVPRVAWALIHGDPPDVLVAVDEFVLTRLLAPHYCRAEDEARSLLREIFRSAADLRVIGHELHVGIKPLSAPRRTRALAGMCADLTATRTTYPGTDLTLVYAVSDN